MTLVIGSTASETGSTSIRMRTIAKHTLPSGEVIKIVKFRGKSQAWHAHVVVPVEDKSCGAPGLIASLASIVAGSGSYSASIASAASRAAVNVSATTNATGLTDVPPLAECKHGARRVVPRRAVTIDQRDHAGHVTETVCPNVLSGSHQQHARHAPRG